MAAMSEIEDNPRVRTVMAELERLGATGSVRILPGSARTAAEAAASLETDVGAIVNSLVFDAAGEPLLVLTSGAHRVDTEALASRAGVSALERATPDLVRAATGFAIGAVSPVGHPAPVRTLVDPWLTRHDTVWAAAGHPRAVFPTTYAELLRLTGGEPVDVGGD